MTAAIILAAGVSSRLGQPKQNLLHNGQTLLQHTVFCAQQSTCEQVIVVLGANTDKIKPVDGTTTLYNNHWQEGMASSIRLAITQIGKDTSIENAIIMVCDQPFISAQLLNSLIDKHTETGRPIVACAYNDTTGPPALFHRSVFAKLLLLQGHEGAKKILLTHAEGVATVPFEKGSIDIDTIADYENLIN
ncbi:nucleotidyltransferase family protein [Mucilaginibacter psychrotolerans]|uniref:Nucleotidyltransferase family protein n=1 Tax=Mucilaginibacter psychrotolerans TaxID=1524096 RepID=A0A4Y8S9N0_9SPHI|nr:nucleotidyltransferase family protein [Mucilaginibacter psychrotolerans]TFF35678.1 nucleotidyltransferase family protein [Mucilaginibacter psychrotolerans]